MEYRKSLQCVGGIHFNLDHQGNSMEGGGVEMKVGGAIQ